MSVNIKIGTSVAQFKKSFEYLKCNDISYRIAHDLCVCGCILCNSVDNQVYPYI